MMRIELTLTNVEAEELLSAIRDGIAYREDMINACALIDGDATYDQRHKLEYKRLYDKFKLAILNANLY